MAPKSDRGPMSSVVIQVPHPLDWHFHLEARFFGQRATSEPIFKGTLRAPNQRYILFYVFCECPKCQSKSYLSLEPAVGIEPTTCWYKSAASINQNKMTAQREHGIEWALSFVKAPAYSKLKYPAFA
jgi:hypothetical protein